MRFRLSKAGLSFANAPVQSFVSPLCNRIKLRGYPEGKRMTNRNILILGDKLVQLIGKQKGMTHPAIDAIVAIVDRRLDANRKKAA